MADGSWKSGLLVCFPPRPLDAIQDSGSYAEKSPERHPISLLGVFGSLGLMALEKDVILAAGLIGLDENRENDNRRHIDSCIVGARDCLLIGYCVVEGKNVQSW